MIAIAPTTPGKDAGLPSTAGAWKRRRVTVTPIVAMTLSLIAAGMGTTEQVRDTLTAGMIPNVTIVPGMVIAFTEMHQRGVAYMYAG